MQESHFNMVDVGPKSVTSRKAEAQGKIRVSRGAFEAIQNHQNPKGDVLALAEVAGIMAAKRTADWIPLCHPLPLEQVRVRFQLCPEDASVKVFCEVSTSAKTGVEMEALCGVNGALLSIYDLSKAIDPVIEISEIRLNFKSGGKAGHWVNPGIQPASSSLFSFSWAGFKAAVVTVSDRVAQGKSEDQSGPYLVQALQTLGFSEVNSHLVSDDTAEIQRAVLLTVKEQGADLVLTTGGTGLSPRDVTPEAVLAISDRSIPGLGELLRSEGARQIRSSWLSRAVATLVGRSLVICLPGSRKAVEESLDTLKDILPHALHIAQGGKHA